MLGISKFVADRRWSDRRVNGAIRDVPTEPPADPALLLSVMQEHEQERRPVQEQEPEQQQIRPSIISDAVCFVGDLTSKGAIHIDGSAKGTVEAETVTVGTGGSLDGKVSCRKLHVKGSFFGIAVCDELIIGEEASVKASLTYKTLLVQRGAQVDGEVFIVE